jgi:hypothetical protein
MVNFVTNVGVDTTSGGGGVYKPKKEGEDSSAKRTK